MGGRGTCSWDSGRGESLPGEVTGSERNHSHLPSSQELPLLGGPVVCRFGQDKGEGEGTEETIQLKILYLDCTEIVTKLDSGAPSALGHGRRCSRCFLNLP